MYFKYAFCGHNPADIRQVNIHEDDVGNQGFSHRYCRGSVLGYTDDLQVIGIVLKAHPEALDKKRLIINQEDSYHRSAPSATEWLQ